jgi:hypothetical protein
MPTGLSILHVIALAPTADAVKVLAPVAVLVVVHAMGVPAIGASGLALAVCVEPPLILCGGLVKFAHGVSFSSSERNLSLCISEYKYILCYNINRRFAGECMIFAHSGSV